MTDRLNDKLVGLARMKANWDGYGSPPVSTAALDVAFRLADSITFMPTADGGLQMEIQSRSLDIEITIAPDGKVGLITEMTT